MGAERRRVLVVSTVELAGSALDDLIGDDDTETMVVVPAVRQSRLQWLANDEDRAREIAERASERLAEETPGETVAARAGDPDPTLAVQDALREFDADEIVIATRSENEAGWLEGSAAQGAIDVDGVPVRRVLLDPNGSIIRR